MKISSSGDITDGHMDGQTDGRPDGWGESQYLHFFFEKHRDKKNFNRGTTLGRPVGKLLAGLKQFYWCKASPLSPDATPNYTIQIERIVATYIFVRG